MDDFRARQVHLDFHTSPAIPVVGDRFDKEEWQKTLQEGHVNSITVFSKCHHGYSYHPSKVNEMHPGLRFDLLGAQLEACKEIGVKAPVYISAGLDEKDAMLHPEWLQRNKDGRNDYGDPFTVRFHLLCLNTPYLDKLLAEIDEVMEVYNPCGIFLDILAERTCYCAKCRRDMTAMGLDFTKDEDAVTFGKLVYRHYLDEVERVVRRHSQTATIFHNSGHILKGRRDLIDTDTHLELESLPTGGWGYDHFPLSAAYVRTLGCDFLGMTGKFHRSWGEFGGFKHPNALRYEVALSQALGAGCSIGDQMHPEGRLNPSTFRLIGQAYAEAEQKEPWCKGAKNISNIAVISAEAFYADRAKQYSNCDVGANRILLEDKQLYDFIDPDADFSQYELLILPDLIPLTGELKERVRQYAANGGKVLLTGRSGVDETGAFALDTGAVFRGANEFKPNYYIPGFETVNGTTEYFMAAQSYLFDNVDAEVLATAQNPYFNRTVHHFCSHQHAPNNRALTYPAVIKKGNVAYIGWEIFTNYATNGDYHIKELVVHVLNELLGEQKYIRTDLPDRGVATLTEQPGRKVLHLLFAHTTKRGTDVEVIEDVVPLYDVKASVRCEKQPTKVLLAPQNEPIPFTYQNGRVDFTVPKVLIHQMVSIEE